MKIKMILVNPKKHNRIWVNLPTANGILSETLKQIIGPDRDNFLVKLYSTKFYIDIPIDSTNIWEVNDKLKMLNMCATDREIIALSEAYSKNLDEILAKVKSGAYEFYPRLTLKKLAESCKCKRPYQHYPTEQILDYMCKLGFIETSTGIIKINNEEKQ